MNSGVIGDIGSDSDASEPAKTGGPANFGVIGDIGSDLPLIDATEWPDPEAFSIPIELPSFPIDALPSPCSDHCMEVFRVVQIAPDVSAANLLSVLAAAGGGRFKVKVGDTHLEPMSLYCVTALPSGERKTATHSHILSPVHEWELNEMEREGPAIAAAIEANKAIDARIDRLRSDAAKTRDFDVKAMQEEVEALERERPKVPPYPTIIVQDITPEALGRKLAQQRGRALIASDEGGVFQMMAGQYSKTGAANLDIYLKGHAGSPITIERITRIADKIPHPALSLTMSVQPAVVQAITGNEELRQRGLLARMLICMPPSMVGHRKYADRGIDEFIADRYRQSILHAFGTTADFPPEPILIELKGHALQAWIGAHDAFECELGEGGRFAAIPDWGSKAPGAVARIAGALHLIVVGDADPTRVPISAETVERAKTIVMYFADHALAILAESGSLSERQARRLLGWIQRQRLPSLSRRTCQQANKGWIDSEQLDAALTNLEQRHFIRRMSSTKPKGPGRPGGEEFRVNPKLVARTGTLCQKPQKPQNPLPAAPVAPEAPPQPERVPDSQRRRLEL